jgi:uncharacterized protein (DUF1778 family)
MMRCIVRSTVKSTERFIEHTEVLRLSPADQKQFAEALLSPPKDAPALKRAFTRRRELVSPE